MLHKTMQAAPTHCGLKLARVCSSYGGKALGRDALRERLRHNTFHWGPLFCPLTQPCRRCALCRTGRPVTVHASSPQSPDCRVCHPPGSLLVILLLRTAHYNLAALRAPKTLTALTAGCFHLAGSLLVILLLRTAHANLAALHTPKPSQP